MGHPPIVHLETNTISRYLFGSYLQRKQYFNDCVDDVLMIGSFDFAVRRLGLPQSSYSLLGVYMSVVVRVDDGSVY